VVLSFIKRIIGICGACADWFEAKFDTAKPWEWAVNTGFKLPPNAQYVENFNVIKPEAGKQAYARVSAAMSNEMFYNQASKSGLMTLGAQHGVSTTHSIAYNG
jgi:hypothetical protein